MLSQYFKQRYFALVLMQKRGSQNKANWHKIPQVNNLK